MQLFANNAASKLVSAISNVALSLQVKAGEGAKFPSPIGGDFFLVTLSKVTGGVENTIEIVRCTARTGDSLTIVRGQEGTTANAYAIDDRIELRMTAGTATATESHINNTSNPHAVTKAQVGLDNVDNTSDLSKPISTAVQAALDLKAPLASPTFTGTVSGITKAMVGLGNVDNTTDAAKPVSTATQTALNLKANLVDPNFSGNVGLGVTDFSATGANAKLAIASGNVNLSDTYLLAWGGGTARPYISGTKSSSLLEFGTGGISRLTIDGSGNLALATGSARASYTNSTTISTTSSFTFNPVLHGQVCKITLTGAITVTFAAPTNIVEGASYKFILTAGNTSARSFAWNVAFKFPAATPTLTIGSTTLDSMDIISFLGGAGNTLIYDGKMTDVR